MAERNPGYDLSLNDTVNNYIAIDASRFIGRKPLKIPEISEPPKHADQLQLQLDSTESQSKKMGLNYTQGQSLFSDDSTLPLLIQLKNWNTLVESEICHLKVEEKLQNSNLESQGKLEPDTDHHVEALLTAWQQVLEPLNPFLAELYCDDFQNLVAILDEIKYTLQIELLQQTHRFQTA